MKARTPEQLASAIESLVASYLDEVRLVAQEALQRSLYRQAGARGPAKGSGRRTQAAKPESMRRTAAEIDVASEQLCSLVCSVFRRTSLAGSHSTRFTLSGLGSSQPIFELGSLGATDRALA